MATPPPDRQKTTQLRRSAPATLYSANNVQTAPSPKQIPGKSHLNHCPLPNNLGPPSLQIRSNIESASTSELRSSAQVAVRQHLQQPSSEPAPSPQPRTSNEFSDQQRLTTEITSAHPAPKNSKFNSSNKLPLKPQPCNSNLPIDGNHPAPQ